MAIALEETNLQWGGFGEVTGATTVDGSGKSNTLAILNYGKKNGISYPAAEHCNSYNTTGTNTGDWFLPSTMELVSLSDSLSKVNNTLTTLGKPIINETKSACYWSSSESNIYIAVSLVISTSIAGNGKKNTSNYVRPVLAF